MSDFAPIALFVFKRLEHTQRALEALALNFEFKDSPLFIFCDGARHVGEVAAVEAVREFARKFPHPAKTVIESPHNLGLANSIVSGVTRLCNAFGRVIVVEDDLIVSPVFLDYMNTALERYAGEPKVMQISGHMFPVEISVGTDAVFLPFTTSWGWATWERAWHHMGEDPEEARMKLMSRHWRYQFDVGGAYPFSRMLAERLANKNNSWAIWWYFQVFSRSGFTLFPRKSLVNNAGFDGSGTHCGRKSVEKVDFHVHPLRIFPSAHLGSQTLKAVKRHLIQNRGVHRTLKDHIWRLFYRGGNVGNA